MIYDFIVVGSGPAGSCLASRLASTSSSPSILLLEAGIAKDESNTELLADRWTAAMKFPDSVESDRTIPQKWLNNRSINYSRGKVLGGSTAINMCAYTVGPKDDYERWAEMVGDESFGWENVTRIRKEKLEDFDGDVGEEYVDYAKPDMRVHGTGGNVSVSYPKVWERPLIVQLDAAKASGLGFNLDGNSGNPLGLASVPSTAKNGRRVTAVKASLESAPSNLTIRAVSPVVKILFDGKKAVGVRLASGEEYRALKEVVISAGAVESPKLLLLSGIGDKRELAKHNIELLQHLPGVGKNLQDHLSIAFCWEQKEGLVDWPQHFANPEAVEKAQAQFREDNSGPLSVFFQGLTIGFFKADEVLESGEYGVLDDDVKSHLKKDTVPIWELSCHIPPCSPNAISAPEKHYLTIFVFLHNPQSRGTIMLSSEDSNARPIIDPEFFSHPFDRQCALAATKRTLDFVRHPLLASNIEGAVDTPASEEEDDVLEFWKDRAGSTWHPSCTVKMGREEDEEACVGSDFKVKGVQNLRVVDLSVLPFLLSCHPVSIAYLVGEIAAEKMITCKLPPPSIQKIVLLLPQSRFHALKHAVHQLRLLVCLSLCLRDSPAAVARRIMWRFLCTASMSISIATLLSLPSTVLAARQTHQYYSTSDHLLLSRNPFELYLRDKRPEDCPPCFNCNLADMPCLQFGNCTKSSGKCSCPPGFGGEDCSQPLCGALPDGKDRLPRQGNEPCQCKEGWEGINCNVCKTNQACNAMMPTGEDGVCYREGVVQKENFQICDITNKKILDTLKEKKPQATFSCNAERAECNFQFWVDQRESFYCGLDTCSWEAQAGENRNTTKYQCANIKCKCVPGRMLCGENGSIDIGDFLEEEIKGPAEFRSTSTDGGSPDDGSAFSEPGMNGLISSVFGDKSIFLKCHSGECLYKNEVPGYQRPIKTINTPLIAGVISGVALFIVAVVLLIFFLNRRFAGRKWGYIHLSEDEEEENARLLADHKPAALLFENISYNLKGKQILTNVTGAVHPGELMAIMGASGAGKTTFLDILARKRKRGLVTGEAWLNGEKVSDDQFQNVIGFVDQDDTMLPTLTVHETILDSALLRLPREMSRAAKEQKVEDVERQLGIYHIKDQIIGSEDSGHGRGISGGEKRRVGIACELVTSPSILFLDEPTSGLDAFNAFNVIECLVTLVKTYNRTVVFTIHQPRSNIVALFDQLILLAHGRTVYSGPFRDCQSYFDSIGYSCPPGFNIADYLVDLTMHASAPIGDDDDLEDQLAEADGRTTRASSTMAIKSIPSISNVSIGESTASAGEPLLRPRGKRKDSIRKQQERQLYSRKPGSIELPSAPSVRSDGGESAFERDMEGRDQQWVRLNKQQGQPIPHIAEDPNNLPPAEEGATGTNLDILVSGYRNSEVAQDLRNDIHNIVSGTDTNGHATGMPNGSLGGKVKGYRKPWIHRQFIILSFRTWRNLYRDPMLMLTHYAIAIVLAVFTGFLFYGLTDDLKGFQNRLGFFFFLLALYGFSALTSLTVFAPERLLFLRERAKGYYAPPAYYLAKLVFDIVPLRLIPPIIMGCIVYPMTGLIPAWGEFFKFILFIVLFNLAAAMAMLFIGICVRNQGVANLLGVLVMLFSLLFGGFLLNHETIPRPLLWLQSLSIFHFAFEGLIVNEVRYLSLVDHKYGLDIEVPGSAILSSFGFDVLALWNDAVGLAVFCAVFLVLGYLSIHFLLVERR
ncbi:hypothetical protein AC578_1269 [Pseudocercospora eumusae]|uniref:ABC transporter domain-containing protein n=1 Tax=Pseudocercospora eumusae TaxID=321146 RepID=A0A139HU76_9PEZI|nr:hypothetical protein AC578_1269 [Pseudocercospora eumusae]